jgi:hypothetical protein
VIRAGYGLFYTRIPQIYTSTIQSENGLAPNFLFLNNNDFYNHQVFPQYPNPLVSCPVNATDCQAPSTLTQLEQADVSAFSHNFKTPRVQQASLNLEREVAHRLAVGVSYTYVHGVDMIRARDVNLPPPVNVTYPVYDSSGTNFLGTYDSVDSFSSWQSSPSLTCPFPPCINPLARPTPQLGSINVFESASSSVYNGGTLSIRRRMTSGIYSMLSYTFAHAVMMDRMHWWRVAQPPCRTPTRPIQKRVRASPISAIVSRFPTCLPPGLFTATMSGWRDVQ